MKNKYLVSTLILLHSLLMIAGTSYAQKKGTVYGEIVELTTFVKDNIKPTSPAGVEITVDNQKKGGTFVLLEKGTGKLVFLTSTAAESPLVDQLKPYIGITVFIKGAIYKKGGIRLVVLEDIGKYLK
ncbi:MAG: hypothetical protein QME25_04680 [Bacteroidota bacterium]|nr:hypothetical protein [Bacteroidota bacterium]